MSTSSAENKAFVFHNNTSTIQHKEHLPRARYSVSSLNYIYPLRLFLNLTRSVSSRNLIQFLPISGSPLVFPFGFVIFVWARVVCVVFCGSSSSIVHKAIVLLLYLYQPSFIQGLKKRSKGRSRSDTNSSCVAL